MNLFNYNSNFSYLGITDLNFMGFLKIIFFILFIILNISLLYCEFKNLEKKNSSESPEYMQSSAPELKKIATYFLGGLSAAANFITINDHFQSKQEKAIAQEALETVKEEVRKIANKHTATNFLHRLHVDSIDRMIKQITVLEDTETKLMNETKLMKSIKEDLSEHEAEVDIEYSEFIRKQNFNLDSVRRSKAKAFDELKLDIERSNKFSTELSKEENDSKILEMINEDIKKSAIFDLDVEELLKKFVNYETLSGLSQLMVTMIISNSLILWCLFGLLINIYGEYLLERFQLEKKYPKLAIIIKYRRKLSIYYILSNILLITLTCLTGIILGVSILSLNL